MHVCPPHVGGYLSDTFASCPPLFICATNTSQCIDEQTDTYTWNFGHYESLEVNACAIYNTPGCYPVTLTVLTDNGCTDTAFIGTVCIGGPRVSSSTVSPTLICACEDSIHFDIGTIGAIGATLVWGCNQGFYVDSPITPIGTNNNSTFLHFAVPYCVTDSCLPQIFLTDSTGCETLYDLPFVHIDSPVVNFIINNYGVCTSGSVCFTDTTRYTLPADVSFSIDWHWEFGDPFDATTSSLQNPCHYYSQQGIYPVTLKIHSNAGCERTITKSFVLSGLPHANFSYQLTADTCVSAKTCFTDLSTASSNTTLAHWQWCFSDTTCNSTGANICHRFANEQTYFTTLTVTDENGCEDDTTLSVTINSIHHLNATASIASIIDSCSGTKVCYTGSSTSESSMVSHIWNLEGNSYTGNSACYYYTSSGFYQALFIVTDNIGCVDTATVSINTSSPNFNPAFTFTVNGITVQFTNTSFLHHF